MNDAALLERLNALTAAIQDLAESNRQVVDLLLAQQAGDEPDAGPRHVYLDGTVME